MFYCEVSRPTCDKAQNKFILHDLNELCQITNLIEMEVDTQYVAIIINIHKSHASTPMEE